MFRPKLTRVSAPMQAPQISLVTPRVSRFPAPVAEPAGLFFLQSIFRTSQSGDISEGLERIAIKNEGVTNQNWFQVVYPRASYPSSTSK